VYALPLIEEDYGFAGQLFGGSIAGKEQNLIKVFA
jgi:hypothetical protein